jgi:hypothetical protein
MPTEEFRIHEITRVDDRLLLPWLDLYEVSFPPSEKALVSTFLAALNEGAQFAQEELQLLAAVDRVDRLKGMAVCQRFTQPNAALLWYLAIVEGERRKGYGSGFYLEIVERLDPSCRALFLEVEIPDLTATPQAHKLADRRISFYRRLGARVLRGIHYLQYVGDHVPPFPMHLMVHILQPLDAAQAFELASAIFGKFISQEGALRLD